MPVGHGDDQQKDKADDHLDAAEFDELTHGDHAKGIDKEPLGRFIRQKDGFHALKYGVAGDQGVDA